MIHLQEPQLKVKQYLLERIKEINLPIPIPNSLPCIQFSGLFVGTAVIIENKDDAAILLNEVRELNIRNKLPADYSFRLS